MVGKAQPQPSSGVVAPEPTPVAEWSRAARPARARSTWIGLGLASVIVVAAWFVGNQQGFDQIGRGGVNQRLLPKVGEVAPPLMALDAARQPVRLSDLRGKPVWLSFWGAWCPPCRAEMPDIVAAYGRLAPEGVVLMSVSVNDQGSYEDSLAFAARSGATFPVLNVPDRTLIADSYPLYNFPTHLFIDAGGVVRAVVPGQLDAASAVRYGESLLAPTGG